MPNPENPNETCDFDELATRNLQEAIQIVRSMPPHHFLHRPLLLPSEYTRLGLSDELHRLVMGPVNFLITQSRYPMSKKVDIPTLQGVKYAALAYRYHLRTLTLQSEQTVNKDNATLNILMEARNAQTMNELNSILNGTLTAYSHPVSPHLYSKISEGTNGMIFSVSFSTAAYVGIITNPLVNTSSPLRTA